MLTRKPNHFQEGNDETQSFTNDSGISQYQEEYLDDAEYGDSLDDYSTDVDNSAEKSKLLIETDSYINRIQLTLENKYIEKRRILKNGVEETKHELRQIPDTRPLANNFGISQIMGHIKGKISHVTMLSNLNKETFEIFVGRFIRDFSRQVIGHKKEWGIKEDNIRDVRRIVIDGVYLSLTRALMDKERGYNWNPTNNIDKKEENKGIMENMMSKFKRRNQY